MIAKFIRSLARQETVIDAFDDKLFVAVVDHVTIGRDGSTEFHIINGIN